MIWLRRGVGLDMGRGGAENLREVMGVVMRGGIMIDLSSKVCWDLLVRWITEYCWSLKRVQVDFRMRR